MSGAQAILKRRLPQPQHKLIVIFLPSRGLRQFDLQWKVSVMSRSPERKKCRRRNPDILGKWCFKLNVCLVFCPKTFASNWRVCPRMKTFGVSSSNKHSCSCSLTAWLPKQTRLEDSKQGLCEAPKMPNRFQKTIFTPFHCRSHHLRVTNNAHSLWFQLTTFKQGLLKSVLVLHRLSGL